MPRRPNLLLLFTDQQRFDTLAAYGNSQIQMPNLNRLAGHSTVFERAYCASPLCTPSRGSILTGLYPHAHGAVDNNIPLPDDVPCIAELVPEGEFVTGYNGKWHLGDEIFRQHGFDEWVSIEDAYFRHYSPGRDPDARSDYHAFLVASGFRPAKGNRFGRMEAAAVPERYSKPAFQADHAVRFIGEHADRPWIYCVNVLEPHNPFTGARDDQYDPDDMPLPPSFDHVPGPDTPLRVRLLQRAFSALGVEGLGLQDEAGWRRCIANYWGLCSLVDTHFGRILEALEATGQFDDTMIVFTSDHGDMMGSHRMITKLVQYEESTRIPLLVKWPGQRRGGTEQLPVSLVDLTPTMLDGLGCDVPDRLQGRCLRSVLEGRLSPADVFIEWNRFDWFPTGDLSEDPLPAWLAELGTRAEIEAGWNALVRTIVTPDGLKLNWQSLGEHELYDLTQDPHEMKNLARDPQCRSILDELVDRIRRWQQTTGDEVELPAV